MRRWSQYGRTIAEMVARERYIETIPICPACGMRCTVCYSHKECCLKNEIR